jgi:hypothetical protein
VAHLWVQKNGGEWAVARLGDEAVVFTAEGPQRIHGGEGSGPNGSGASLLRAILIQHQASTEDTWALVAAPDGRTFVNGRALTLGLCVLRDKDEIRVDGGAAGFFSTERLAVMELFAGSASPTVCPRCRRPIRQGEAIVRCPRCRVAHHQTQDLPCWTGYDDKPFDTCAMNDHAARLGGDFEWSPASL